MDRDRLTSLASTALALKAASPALLHSIRGSLHDVTMLAALLQPSSHSPLPDAAKSAQRLRSIADQLVMLEQDVSLLAAFVEGPRREAGAVCGSAAALARVVRLLKDEAARKRIRFESDLDAMPAHVGAGERSLQQALLACGAWVAQHAGERATMHIAARDEGGEAVFDFQARGWAGADDDTRDDLALLAELVRAAGGRLDVDAGLRVAFPAGNAAPA